MKKGSKHSEQSRKKMSESALKNPQRYWLGKNRSGLNKGMKKSEESIQKWRKTMMGRDLSWLQTPEIRNKRNANIKRGADHTMWKGGVTPLYKTIRKSPEYKQWREAVFMRDNWTCQECGIKGGKLHPDHIKPFATYPELRFDISNGRTLCVECHRKTPTWGSNVKE